MSSFKKLFGGGKTAKSSDPRAAVDKLRELEDIQLRKIDFLEKKISDETASAKANVTKNRAAAMSALKRKKRWEEQLTHAEGTLLNIQTQRETLDTARLNAETFKAMHGAGKALKTQHKNLDSDKVHEAMDDFVEQQDLAKEIGEAISTPGMDSSLIDDDDLLSELAELQQDEMNKEFEKVNLNLPSVPQSVPAGSQVPSKITEEEKELQELQAMMAS